MKRKHLSPLLSVFILLASSCGLYKDQGYKQVSYYQDVDRTKPAQEAITNFQPLKIQPGDILGVNVSSVNQEAASVFNTSINHQNGNNLDNSATNPVYGFRVDANGQVQLPDVGTMKVAGLTTDEVAKQLTISLADYLKSPIVSVRLLNFKISVLGDVTKPDVYAVPNEHININEALSMAGDLTITAKRTNVLLIREENGQRQFITIDLTRKDVFNSPYYYLHNNDVLYVDADKVKYDNVARSYKTNTLVIAGLASLLAIVVSALYIYHR
jgi:polysaccharide export outer membrane protein